jgi:PAS domain-containing protein
LIGHSVLSLVAESDRDRFREHLQGLSPQKRSGIIEHRVIGVRGEIRWHLRVDRVLLDPAGRVAEIETVAREITAEHQRRLDLQNRDAIIQAFSSAPPKESWP